jgi:hypothetical protein
LDGSGLVAFFTGMTQSGFPITKNKENQSLLPGFCLCFVAILKPIQILYMKKIFTNAIDFSKVETLVYHLPDGPSFSVEMDGIEEIFDFEMEIGDVCDTSDIDGVVHFFPRGNA